MRSYLYKFPAEVSLSLRLQFVSIEQNIRLGIWGEVNRYWINITNQRFLTFRENMAIVAQTHFKIQLIIKWWLHLMKNSLCNEGVVLQIALRRYRPQWIKSAIFFLVYSREYVPSYTKLVLLKNKRNFS